MLRLSHGLAGLLSASAFGLVLAGCKAKPKPPERAAPPPPPSASAEPSARCRELGTGPQLTVGDVSAPGQGTVDEPDAGDDDEATELPFATRVDSSVALGREFAVGGLGNEGKQTAAFVALVPFDGTPGRRVSLGAVHGDVDPPLLAAQGEALLAAVSDMDAGGGMLRLTRLASGAERPSGELDVTGVAHDAGAALAAGEHGALLVWGAESKRGVALKALAVDPEKLAGVGSPVELRGTLGAESPLLVARPGGYWLGWVSPEAPETTDAGPHAGLKPLEGAAHGASPARPDAGAHGDAGLEEGGELVDSGPRKLFVLPLDAGGKPLAPPRIVSAAARVVGFAAAILPDSALALCYRRDDAAPGAESAAPELVRVSLDGAVTRGKLEDEGLSAGTPALLADPRPSGRIWVGLESASEGTRVGLLGPAGLGLDALIGDRVLRGTDLLAAGDGKLLFARHRGRAVELGVLECRASP